MKGNDKNKTVSGSEGGSSYLTRMRNGVQEDVGFIPQDRSWWDARMSEPEMDRLELLLLLVSHPSPTYLPPSAE